MPIPKEDLVLHKRAHSRARAKKMRRQRRESGLCWSCGAPAQAKTMCYDCWLYATASNNGVVGPDRGEQIRRLLVSQGYKCALTGEPLVLGVNATIDHKVPKSRGGGNEIDNLQWITWRVNMMKTDMLVEELYELCEVVLKHRDSQLAIVKEFKAEEK